MLNNGEKLERLSARLDKETREKAEYLQKLGYGPTELVKKGIELLYQQALTEKPPSIPALLETLARSSGKSPGKAPRDLAANHKKYYKELLIAKRIG